MSSNFNNRHFDLLTSDRFHIDGEAYVFAGETDGGYLFFQPDNLAAIVEIAAGEMAEVMLEPGRFLLEPEYHKKGSRK